MRFWDLRREEGDAQVVVFQRKVKFLFDFSCTEWNGWQRMMVVVRCSRARRQMGLRAHPRRAADLEFARVCAEELQHGPVSASTPTATSRAVAAVASQFEAAARRLAALHPSPSYSRECMRLRPRPTSGARRGGTRWCQVDLAGFEDLQRRNLNLLEDVQRAIRVAPVESIAKFVVINAPRRVDRRVARDQAASCTRSPSRRRHRRASNWRRPTLASSCRRGRRRRDRRQRVNGWRAELDALLARPGPRRRTLQAGRRRRPPTSASGASCRASGAHEHRPGPGRTAAARNTRGLAPADVGRSPVPPAPRRRIRLAAGPRTRAVSREAVAPREAAALADPRPWRREVAKAHGGLDELYDRAARRRKGRPAISDPKPLAAQKVDDVAGDRLLCRRVLAPRFRAPGEHSHIAHGCRRTARHTRAGPRLSASPARDLTSSRCRVSPTSGHPRAHTPHPANPRRGRPRSPRALRWRRDPRNTQSFDAVDRPRRRACRYVSSVGAQLRSSS